MLCDPPLTWDGDCLEEKVKGCVGENLSTRDMANRSPFEQKHHFRDVTEEGVQQVISSLISSRVEMAERGRGVKGASG